MQIGSSYLSCVVDQKSFIAFFSIRLHNVVIDCVQEIFIVASSLSMVIELSFERITFLPEVSSIVFLVETDCFQNDIFDLVFR